MVRLLRTRHGRRRRAHDARAEVVDGLRERGLIDLRRPELARLLDELAHGGMDLLVLLVKVERLVEDRDDLRRRPRERAAAIRQMLRGRRATRSFFVQSISMVPGGSMAGGVSKMTREIMPWSSCLAMRKKLRTRFPTPFGSLFAGQFQTRSKSTTCGKHARMIARACRDPNSAGAVQRAPLSESQIDSSRSAVKGVSAAVSATCAAMCRMRAATAPRAQTRANLATALAAAFSRRAGDLPGLQLPLPGPGKVRGPVNIGNACQWHRF